MPGSTNSSTSAMVILPAMAMSGLKLRAVLLKIKLPSVSPFHAFTMAKSALKAVSNKYSLPSKILDSLPIATSVPTPAGVNIAGMP